MMGQWDPHTPVMGQWGHYLRKQVATFFVLRQLTTPQLTTTQLTTTQLYTRSVHPSGTPLYYVAPSPIVAPPRLSKARAAAYRGRQLGDSSHAAWHLGYLPPHMHMRSSHALKARLQAPHPELVARVAQHARPACCEVSTSVRNLMRGYDQGNEAGVVAFEDCFGPSLRSHFDRRTNSADRPHMHREEVRQALILHAVSDETNPVSPLVIMTVVMPWRVSASYGKDQASPAITHR